MIQKEYDLMIRIMVLGDSGVGKSSILNSYTKGIFKDNQSTTIGIDYRNKNIIRNNVSVKLQIWDTAGEERYHSITNISIRDADAILITYDITNYQSFQSIKDKWAEMIHNACRDNISVVIVGNKNDLESQREVSTAQSIEFTEQNGYGFFETSAKELINVEKAFEYLVDKVLEKFEAGSYQPVTKGIKLEKSINDENSIACGPSRCECS